MEPTYVWRNSGVKLLKNNRPFPNGAGLDSVNDASASPILVVRVARHTCALDLAHVIEIMRPLPVSPVAGAPEIVLGLAIIRGAPVPVVDFAALFGAEGGPCTRWVLVRAGDRRVALAVDEVPGIHALSHSALNAMPPLLQGAAAGALDTIGTLDSELLFVLKSAGIVGEELWTSLER